jgi:hypothetical protein
VPDFYGNLFLYPGGACLYPLFLFKSIFLGWEQGGEMTQALYAHMNNKTIKKKVVGKENGILFL